MTLTDFLLARIAEDEAVAKPNICLSPHSAAKMLAECEAKRRIVDENESTRATPLGGKTAGDLWRAVRILAAVYADHPDYRDEWKP